MTSLRKRILTENWERVDTPDGGFVYIPGLISEHGYPFIEQKLSPTPHKSQRADVLIYRNMIKVCVQGRQPEHLKRARRAAVDVEFSGKSRKRMLDTFNSWRMPQEGKFFLHLTYPAEYPLDWRIWKSDLKRFKQMLLRRWPQAQGIWKLELQRRGAPHYHIVLSLGKWVSIKRFRQWVDAAWARIAHEHDQYGGKYACRTEMIFSTRHAMNYAAKYCTKPNLAPVDDDGVILTLPDLGETIGRHWGRIGKLDCGIYEAQKISLQELTFTRVALAKAICGMGARGWRGLLRPRSKGSFTIYGLGGESDERYPNAQSVLIDIRKRFYEEGGAWGYIWDMHEAMEGIGG